MLRTKLDNGAYKNLDNDRFTDFEIDVSLLDYNLSLSYENRIKQHQNALDLVMELQKVGKNLRARKDEIGS